MKIYICNHISCRCADLNERQDEIHADELQGKNGSVKIGSFLFCKNPFDKLLNLWQNKTARRKRPEQTLN